MVCTGTNLILGIIISDTSHIIIAKPSDNILTFKKNIEGKFGKSLENYFCYFEAKYLNDNMTLAKCGLSNMAFLEMHRTNIGLIKIFIKDLCGTIITVMISMSSTIESLKTKVKLIRGVPKDQQRLLLNTGKELEDKRTLADYNIKNNSVIWLVLRLRGC